MSYEPILEFSASKPASLFVSASEQGSIVTGDPAKGVAVGQIEKDEISQWLLKALCGELQRAGYFLKARDNEAKYQISLGMIHITDHKMSLEISVKEKEELIFIKSYSSAITLTLPVYKIFFGLQHPVNDLLNASLSEIYEQFIIDLSQVVQ